MIDIPIVVSISSFDLYSVLKKPSVLTVAEYKDGECLSASYEYRVPMKRNEIRGYSEQSWRVYGYDENLKPSWTAWHLESASASSVITVYFTPEGKVDRAAVEYTPAEGKALAWEQSPDGTLLSMAVGHVHVQDLSKADPGNWEVVSFD